MNSRTLITLLAGLAIAEGALLVGLLGGKAVFPDAAGGGASAAIPSGASGASRESAGAANGATARPGEPAALEREKVQLEAKLAEVTKELNERKSEISFSYGSVAQSGRFVGMTFRKMFETAAARETSEAQARMADNQINVLSLGPFIQDAEVFESDPAAFAQFQAPLIGEVLGLGPQQTSELESALSSLKAQSLKLEEGSPEWIALNDQAMQRVTSLLPADQRQALRSRLEFFEQYGVLVIPAYSILRAPTPTVVK